MLNDNFQSPAALVLDELVLNPYQYYEHTGYDGTLSIRARVVLSESQHSDLGKLPRVVSVVRSGIDETPREMELYEVAWSKNNDVIKEAILLLDKESKDSLPAQCYIGNLLEEVAKQKLMLNNLLDILITTSALSKEQLKNLKAKSTREEIWPIKREFYRVGIDLDQFKTLEEEWKPPKK